MAYVLKLTDLQYSSFTYITKGSILAHGRHGFFLEDSVFETAGEAVDHIQTRLDSGWYRPDITHANFEVVEVKQYPEIDPFFYYTEDAAEKYKNL
jgi:hypothetical protein